MIFPHYPTRPSKEITLNNQVDRLHFLPTKLNFNLIYKIFQSEFLNLPKVSIRFEFLCFQITSLKENVCSNILNNNQVFC